MKPALRQRSTAKGVALFLLASAFYAGSLLATVAVGWLPATLALGALNGLAIGALFVVAHDACHGSLTRSAGLNAVLGRLAFLPALQPFSTWELGHNRLHHGLTNLRGRDYVWAPLSAEEYRGLGRARRALERFYRSPAGLGAYHLVEVWWKHLVCPRPGDLAAIRGKRLLALDLALVALFLALEAAAVVALDRHVSAVATPWPRLLATALLWPFLAWTWLMGFLTFLHHTSPATAWYATRAEWSFYRGQVRNTVHVRFPGPVGLLLHNIMEHTAHHVDPSIPLYNLPAGQRQLEARYEEVLVAPWSIRGFLSTMATCQLYDYRAHRWLDFRGRPTTEPHPAFSRDAEACQAAAVP